MFDSLGQARQNGCSLAVYKPDRANVKKNCIFVLCYAVIQENGVSEDAKGVYLFAGRRLAKK